MHHFLVHLDLLGDGAIQELDDLVAIVHGSQIDRCVELIIHGPDVGAEGD